MEDGPKTSSFDPVEAGPTRAESRPSPEDQAGLPDDSDARRQMSAAGPREPSDAERQLALFRVRARLKEAGVSVEEINTAEAEGLLDLLTVDRMLLPTRRRYTQRELAEKTGLPLDLFRRFWRALGFLDVGEDERVLTDLDIESIQLFQGLLDSGLVDIESAVQLARVIGASMARIAEAEVSPHLPGSASEDPIIAADEFSGLAVPALPAMSQLLDFVWRRHMIAAARRAMLLRSRGQAAGSPVLAVGFADMVGFTLLSQHLTDRELADVIRRFEEVSQDIVTALGGHAVKMIGDEIMFVVDGAGAAVRIGLALAEAYSADDVLSDVRVGLAVGPVIASDGDYYGPTVNLAHRIVNVTTPGTVVVSDEFWSTLRTQAHEEFDAVPLQPRVLKDIGRVQLWRVFRYGDPAPGPEGAADRSREARWERLAGIREELEELARDLQESRRN